jgi:hypothetical protein
MFFPKLLAHKKQRKEQGLIHLIFPESLNTSQPNSDEEINRLLAFTADRIKEHAKFFSQDSPVLRKPYESAQAALTNIPLREIYTGSAAIITTRFTSEKEYNKHKLSIRASDIISITFHKDHQQLSGYTIYNQAVCL